MRLPSLLLFPLLAHATGITPTWTSLAPLPTHRQEHPVVALNNKVYILGGIFLNPSGSSFTTNTFQRFSPATNTWTHLAPLPLPLNHINLAPVNGKLYVLGGLSAAVQNPQGINQWEARHNCYVYNPATDAWTALTPMPNARGSAAVGVYHGVVYLAGGLNVLVLGPGGLQDTVDTVSAYDTKTGQWSTLPPVPEGRDHVGGAVVDGVFYLVGGRKNGQVNVKNTVFAMDLRRPRHLRRWESLARMPTARGGLAVAVVGDDIYAFGGEGNTAVTSGIFPQVEAYDTRTNRWKSLGEMPLPRHGMAAASVGGKIFIPGGGIRQGAAPVDHHDAFIVGAG